MTRKESRIIHKHRWWIAAVLMKRLDPSTPARRSFLKFVYQRSEPTTMVQRAWKSFTELHKGRTLQEAFLMLAKGKRTSQKASQDDLIDAYQLAACVGSHEAQQWLKEQRLPRFPNRSIWTRDEISTFDVNGLA